MRKDEVLSAIIAAKNAGSFKLKLIFATWAEVGQARSFVTMLNSDSVAVDDETVMRLRIVAISRRWQDDTDRVVIMTMGDNFDESEFIGKFAYAIESLTVMPLASLANEAKKHDGATSPKKAIRKAMTNGKREIRIAITKATSIDVMMFMQLVEHGYISFLNQGEQMVFEEVTKGHDWSLGGKLSADILIKNELPEHTSRRVLDGAHVHVKKIQVVR